MPESPERRQVNIRLDPSHHMLMDTAKRALGASSVSAVYEQAVEEFLANHPELFNGVEAELQAEAQIVTDALEKLSEIRSRLP